MPAPRGGRTGSRPARAHAASAGLTRTVLTGEDVLAGRADLKGLHRASLKWRARSDAPTNDAK